MNNTQRVARLALVGAGFAAAAGFARADTVQARLSGFQEVPSVSTVAGGRFKAKINEHGGSVFWELEYEGLQADATQAHIHFGQRHTNGGITVWLCGNLASPPTPVDTQPCPLRAGATYVNVHAAVYPRGEFRGQIRRGQRDD